MIEDMLKLTVDELFPKTRRKKKTAVKKSKQSIEGLD
jgi:hypothetical protein